GSTRRRVRQRLKEPHGQQRGNTDRAQHRPDILYAAHATPSPIRTVRSTLTTKIIAPPTVTSSSPAGFHTVISLATASGVRTTRDRHVFLTMSRQRGTSSSSTPISTVVLPIRRKPPVLAI